MKTKSVIIAVAIFGGLAFIGLIAFSIVVTAIITQDVEKEEKALKAKQHEIWQRMTPEQRAQIQSRQLHGSKNGTTPEPSQ